MTQHTPMLTEQKPASNVVQIHQDAANILHEFVHVTCQGKVTKAQVTSDAIKERVARGIGQHETKGIAALSHQ